jgi:hypothetical protein
MDIEYLTPVSLGVPSGCFRFPSARTTIISRPQTILWFMRRCASEASWESQNSIKANPLGSLDGAYIDIIT